MKQFLSLLIVSLTALLCQANTEVDVFSKAYDKSTHTLDIRPYVTQYGLPKDCSPAVVRALDDCRNHTQVRKLLFPQNTYRFRPETLKHFMTYISNHGAFERCFAFDLTGIRNLEIDGQGSEFLFKGFVCPFYVNKAQNISLRNLQIDYERTFNTEGHIVNVTDEYMDLRFGEEYPYRVEADSTFHALDDEGVEYAWYYLLEFNPKTQETEWKVSDQWTGASIKTKDLGDRTVRFLKPGLKGKVGNVMNLGIAYRKVPAITVSDSKRFQLHNVTIWQTGGMGVIGQRSRDLLIDSLIIKPRPGKDRTTSVAADATHFVNCSGYLHMYNCHLASQTDDATNIHGVYYRITALESPTRMQVELGNDAQYGFDYLKPGMRIEFVHPTDLTTFAYGKVRSAQMNDMQHFTVELTKPIPESVSVKDAIAGCQEYPDVHIKGCYFGKNRARGLLLGSRGRMLLEENTFHNGGPAILFEGDARYWFEQSGVRNVIIRNNLFDNCYYGHWGRGIISVGSGLDAEGRKVCRYNQNIRIQDNTFRLIQEPIMDLYCVKGLDFSGNRIVLSHDYPNNIDTTQPQQLFNIKDCDDIHLQDIQFENE